MDKATLDRVFEPFFSTKPMGRGMGLAATQGIIRSHKGQILAESKPGSGSTLTVWLPASRADVSEDSIAATKSALAPPRGTETLFIIAGDEAVSNNTEQLLASLGYCTVAHTDSDDARAFLQNNREDIDLILLVDGSETSLAQLAEQTIPKSDGIPVVVLENGSESPATAEKLGLSDADHLCQPVSLMDLARAVRRVLDSRSEQNSHG
jgi:hypothetical protein